MSLIRQLWLGVGLLMAAAFIASFSLSTFVARGYFEDQLHLKNMDNANALALTLSRSEKDRALIETYVAAQFDTGHYERMTLTTPRFDDIDLRAKSFTQPMDVPDWFRHWVSIDAAPGKAGIMDGWREFGTLTVESQDAYAYEALWEGTKKLFALSLAVMAVFGLVGSLILKRVLKPLDAVISQAEAIGEQRFIESPVPSTLEFRRVVQAMNRLSLKIKNLLLQEREQLEAMKVQSQHDDLTGLMNRNMLNQRLEGVLKTQDQGSRNGIVFVRLINLPALNHSLGYERVDELLIALAQKVSGFVAEAREAGHDAWAGRMKGADFAAVIRDIDTLDSWPETLFQQLMVSASAYSESRIVAVAACQFEAGESRADVLGRLDGLLAQAEPNEHAGLVVADAVGEAPLYETSQEWWQALVQALEQETFFSRVYPVFDKEQRCLHSECMLRLRLKQVVRTAGQVLPWIRRLGLLPAFDRAMVKHTLLAVENNPALGPLCVNLSAETLQDPDAQADILSAVRDAPRAAANLCIDIPESVALDHTPAVWDFVGSISALGSRVGLDHSEMAFLRSEVLQSVGLAYIKLDHSVTADLPADTEKQLLVQRFCGMAHAIGLTVIADGLTEPPEATHWRCGLDATAGPAVPEPDS